MIPCEKIKALRHDVDMAAASVVGSARTAVKHRDLDFLEKALVELDRARAAVEAYKDSEEYRNYFQEAECHE